MTDDNFTLPADVDDAFDSDGTNVCFEGLKQDIAKLEESRRRRRNRMKQEMAKLKESKEKYERDYRYESCQREKDNESWRRKLTDKCEDVKALKREMAGLRGQVKQLRVELRAKTHQLQRMNHLVCDICYDKEKCRVTRCGHGFCADCLCQVFNTAAQEAILNRDGVSVIGEVSCPACRRRLNQTDDVWPIYLSEAVE